jgi:prevent-host-death family protein
MNKIIGVTELQRNFRRVFDEVARDGVPYILTRDSRPEVVMIPYEEFVRLQQAREAEILARLDRLLAKMQERSAGLSDEEIEEDLRAARKELERS